MDEPTVECLSLCSGKSEGKRSVDEMSRGRTELGLGLSDRVREAKASV